MGVILILGALSCWFGKSGLFEKKVIIKSKSFKLIFTRLLPVILVLSALYLNYPPIADYIDPKIIRGEGTLYGISYSSKTPQQYNVRIDKIGYRIPSRVKNHSELKKGYRYNFTYLSRSKIIMSIALDD